MSSSTYISDYWASQDALRFSLFTPALMDILRNAETPLTLGVFGPWGSGKTSLLHMLEQKILAERLPGFRPVWFTAWKYEHEEALWRAFLLRVIDGLYPKDDTGERLPQDRLTDEEQRKGVQHLDRLARSLYETVSWQGDERWSLDVGKTAKEAVKLPIWLALHLVKLGAAAKDLGLTPQMAELIGRAAQEHRLNQLASMEQFESAFQEALSALLGREGRLVIFVDDLDRCLPEKAIQVLEAIKLFLNVPQTVFVLGMDREVIRRGIESHYRILMETSEEGGDLPVNGDVYLQKLIQIPFNLPPLDLDGREAFITALEKPLDAAGRLSDVTRQVFARGLLPNPRQVKRALNIFTLLKAIAREQEAQGVLPPGAMAWPLLAKTVLIQSQWPELYSLWRQYPTLLQTLEEEYARQPLSEEELVRGRRAEAKAEASEAASSGAEPPAPARPPQPRPPAPGGLLEPYLTRRRDFALLIELLTYPDQRGEGQERAWFRGLSRAEMLRYVGLAGAASPQAAPSEAAPPLPVTLQGFLDEIMSGDPALAREAMARVAELGPERKNLEPALLKAARDPDLEPVKRADAADALDELGGLPEDLYTFLPIPFSPASFLITKYPITNVQYARFVADEEAFRDRTLWEDFPQFDERSRPMKETTGRAGWDWLQAALKDKEHSPDGVRVQPGDWDDPHFGARRKAAPVVGVTWWEANAYARWLQRHWGKLEEGKRNTGAPPQIVRLPTEAEWAAAAGGEEPEERYPWDAPGEAATKEREILHRANTAESGIRRTTVVGMYPLGESQYHVADLAGNVWEWQANYYNEEHDYFAVRGGSMYYDVSRARVSSRDDALPYFGWDLSSFRLVCPNESLSAGS